MMCVSDFQLADVGHDLLQSIGLKSYILQSAAVVKCLRLRHPTFQRIFGAAE